MEMDNIHYRLVNFDIEEMPSSNVPVRPSKWVDMEFGM